MSQTQPKGIAILGSTGSIGTQALQVIKEAGNYFSVELLTANSNADLLIEQALAFNPNTVIIVDESKYNYVKDALSKTDVKVFAGINAVCDCVQMSTVQTVLTAMVGYAGLLPTIAAIKAGKDIALANKETLVVAGQLITQLAKQHGVNIYPVDSEHSAIFQCLVGEFHNKIEKIYLTASGGPFRGKKLSDLASVTRAQALKHPNWTMGAKITIDSATLMNKGLEVIEAKWLFGLTPKEIDVIVHPQSIIHSIVQFQDGSMKAQMGLPDMKIPIQFAMTYPDRIFNDFKRFSFLDYPSFTFEKPDLETFRCLGLAFDAIDKGGNVPCALNAANEISVQAFLEDKIKFTDIARINEETMIKANFVKAPTLDDYIQTNQLARELATGLI
jgi:1-deoxy-D-xylulose-5-phosphate reductoisomerase